MTWIRLFKYFLRGSLENRWRKSSQYERCLKFARTDKNMSDIFVHVSWKSISGRRRSHVRAMLTTTGNSFKEKALKSEKNGFRVLRGMFGKSMPIVTSSLQLASPAGRRIWTTWCSKSLRNTRFNYASQSRLELFVYLPGMPAGAD